jgi:hypothetical protein
METQKTSNRQTNSEQKSNARGITIHDFKVHRDRAIKYSIGTDRKRQWDHWNRIED